MDSNKIKFYRRVLFHVLILFTLISPAMSASAKGGNVVSENLIYLQEDGRSYLLHRSMRTDWPRYDFHVDKDVGLNKFKYIYPQNFQWDDRSSPDTNILKFNTGQFAVIYPGRFDKEVTVDDQGIYTFKSWDGKKEGNGHFGYWNKPVNFSSFVFGWVFPSDFEIISYKSNRKGKWTRRGNTIVYQGADVNDLTFTIQYRRKEAKPQAEPAAQAGGAPKPTIPPVPTGEPPKAMHVKPGTDSDGDGIVDSKDKCPNTPPATLVNAEGCIPDADKDGIIDAMDACPDTPAGVKVNNKGCELDSDGDGVVDSKDKCPETAAGVKVDEQGCEVDSDGDGVVDSKDKCPETPAGSLVGADGCIPDADKDGIVDAMDACPDTPTGVKVNDKGCELDSDGDGVVDSKDKCPETATGVKVDEQGCEVDSDGDGVVDSKDKCPNTPVGAKIDDKGCELDTDGDGIADSKDQCPDTAPGQQVGDTGCPLIADADKDGIADDRDLCPETVAGSTVDVTGCDLSKPIPLPGVKFVFGSADLTKESIGILNHVAEILARYPDLKLEVAGHTDSVGKAAYNKYLSQKRAESVRDYLIGKGIPAENLTAVGYGETHPIASNRTLKGQRLNRRVELRRR